MPATAVLTSEQFLNLTDELDPHGNRIRQELIHGEVVQVPPASQAHSVVVGRVLRELIGYLLSNPHLRLEVLAEAAVVVNERDTLVPDCIVISEDRLNPSAEKYLSSAPEIAVEVVSPSESAAHLKSKIDSYLAAGAQSVWVVYPDSRSVTIYTHESVRDLKGDDALEDPVLPGFRIPASLLFLGI